MLTRNFLRIALLCAAAVSFTTASHAADPVKIRFILNWKYQGPQAWFFVAQPKASTSKWTRAKGRARRSRA